jgi:hypothetical protein
LSFLELVALDVLEGNLRNPDRITYSVQLWLWSMENKLPPDFLNYPADVVKEVQYLQRVGEMIRADIEAKLMREHEERMNARRQQA